jgi:hypothetical protein
MRIRKQQPYFSFKLWLNQGAWFWRLSSPSDARGVVGAAPSADEAAREACASLEEIEPGICVIAIAPMLRDAALTWNGVLEGFERVAVHLLRQTQSSRQRPAGADQRLLPPAVDE